MSMGSRSLPPPTAEEIKRWALICEKGCIVAHKHGHSFVPCEIHHLKSGNLRIGHLYTIGLSAYIHRGEYMNLERGNAYGVSLADGSRRFHAVYGSDQELLDYQQDLIGEPRITIPARRIKQHHSNQVTERGAVRATKRKSSNKSRCTRSEKTVPHSGKL